MLRIIVECLVYVRRALIMRTPEMNKTDKVFALPWEAYILEGESREEREEGGKKKREKEENQSCRC